MKLTFNGAAKTVTGSCYLIETGNKKILVDCGIFQGPKELVKMNYEEFRFNPKEINFMLLTHAHADHSGLIPKLVKKGFRGKIFATPPTIDLTKLMLEDSAHINEEDTEQENKRRMREGMEVREPLFTVEDARRSFNSFQPVEYNKDYQLANGIAFRFINAGHILGSCIIEVRITEGDKTSKFIFSGDLGQWGEKIISSPTIPEDADYVIMESTYGSHKHHGEALKEKELLEEVTNAYKRGGKLLIPSFAIERTQEILYYLHRIAKKGKLHHENVFLDSPLAINATKIFGRYQKYFNQEIFREFKEPFAFKQLKCLKTSDESKELNNYKKPCIIIAGNGMCSGGRIRHHLKHNLWKPQNTLLFVGYQAEGSLGRYILEGAKTVKMMGITVAVNAKVTKINSFSAHADAGELVKWVTGIQKKPRKVFIVHGELSSSQDLQKNLESQGLNTHIPDLGESVELD